MTAELFSLVLGCFPYTNVFSIAPIRTKPRRTYDQFNEEFKPEGDHVPLKMARLLESEEAEDQAYGETVKRHWRGSGEESGLFDTVEIERAWEKSRVRRFALQSTSADWL